MLHSVNALYDYRIGATDGLAGGIVDFYFNDQDWSVRHIVASQHRTRLYKGVLMAPAIVKQVDDRENVMHVALSRAECDAQPPATSVVPVCRQYLVRSSSACRAEAAADPHIRSTNGVDGYEINDGEQHLGIVHDFLIDPRSWTIAFLVGRRFGAQEREFLVAVSAVSQISFATRRVAIRKASHWDLVFEARNGYDRLLDAEAA